MKILWIINNMLPEAAAVSGRKSGFGGGWIASMSAKLKNMPDIQFSIVVFGKNDSLERIEADHITYYVFPRVKNLYRNGGGKHAASIWRRILNQAAPDLVHVYGTEQPTCLALLQNFPQVPVVVSLQGILTEYHRHYYGCMEFTDLIRHITLADILLGSSGIFGRQKFQKNIPAEQEILRRVRYAEGRTAWDQAVAANINPEIQYYHCPRMLRNAFYESRPWNPDEMVPHSIFVHQGNYAIKGLHVLVEAMSIVRRSYPDVTLHIAGQSPKNKTTLKGKLSVNGYTRFVLNRIKTLGLEDAVEYLGGMNETEVANQLRKSHVTVIPSAIENSPNSLAEAMLIGTPCVASYVGGSPEMLGNGSAGELYSYNDPIMLARSVMRIFESDELARTYSGNARRIAEERHNRDQLPQILHDIYEDILVKERNTGEQTYAK